MVVKRAFAVCRRLQVGREPAVSQVGGRRAHRQRGPGRRKDVPRAQGQLDLRLLFSGIFSLGMGRIVDFDETGFRRKPGFWPFGKPVFRFSKYLVKTGF